MSIVNPQYEFLKTDFHNPNLIHKKFKVEIPSEEIQKQRDFIDDSTTTMKIKPSIVYKNLYWMINYWFITIPMDIYCAAILVIAKYMSLL